MRPYLIAGIVLIGLGGFVLVRGASYTSRRDVLKVGDVQVSATQQRSIPPWVGGAVMVGGAALILVGTRKRAA